MRVLITGSGGQVGLDLIPFLQARGAEVFASDIVERPKACSPGVPWEHFDVTDPTEVLGVMERVKPDVVYHLAAILSARGEDIPHVAYAVNQTGTYNMLEACRQLGTPKFIYTSTIAAFGPNLPDPVPNEVSLMPTTMYGVTKVAGEMLGNYYHEKWGLDFRGVRFPGLINAGVPGGGTTDYALHMYVDSLQHGAYECYVGPESTVPMMYMPDALRAMVELSEVPRSRLGRCIYNIAAVSPTA